MCGIGVYIDRSGISRPRRARLEEVMLRESGHRGPDSFGSINLRNETILLLHNRLSLVDLSGKGGQPMERLGLTIVFNGEIYNYREIRIDLESVGYEFTTDTDTEVIIYAYHKWGVECLKCFNGAFAFVIYDSTKDYMFIARDRVGEKPLYVYHHSDGSLIYTSSIRQIMYAFDKEWRLDPERIAADLIFNFWSDKKKTHIEDILSICPGTYQVVNLKDFTTITERYWAVPESDVELTNDTFQKTIGDLLVDSVSMRVKMDVPYGTVLSGGLDSTLLTEIAIHNYAESDRRDKFLAFTLHREGSSDEDSSYAQRYASERDKIKHVLVSISDGDMTKSSFIETTRYMEEPLLDYVYIYISRNYEEARRAGLKAVLNGQGADELFLGYLDYYEFLRDASTYSSYDTFVKYWYKSSDRIMQYMRGIDVKEVINNTLKRNYRHDNKDPLSGVLRFGMRTHLPALLAQEDKQAMRWSIECRTCYTDYRLVELAAKMPSRMKMIDNKEKYPLRRVAEKFIPSYIINREKLGFPSLNDPKHILVDQLISEGALQKSTFMVQNFDNELFKIAKSLPFALKWKLVAIAIFDSEFVGTINADEYRNLRK